MLMIVKNCILQAGFTLIDIVFDLYLLYFDNSAREGGWKALLLVRIQVVREIF